MRLQFITAHGELTVRKANQDACITAMCEWPHAGSGSVEIHGYTSMNLESESYPEDCVHINGYYREAWQDCVRVCVRVWMIDCKWRKGRLVGAYGYTISSSLSNCEASSKGARG